MFKYFLYNLFIFFSFYVYATETNPVVFLEKVISETKPALMTRNDFVLEEAMEKYIDFEEMAIWVCGKNIWFSSKISEKKIFLDELKKLMLKTYSRTVYYYVDADVDFLKPNLDPKMFENKKRVQINSIMKKDNKSVSISYRLVKNKETWLVYDVLIEGISILKSLKTQYSDMIKNKGLEYTIDKIKTANKL